MIKTKKNQKGSILYFSILILGILFSAGITVTTVLIQRIGMIEEMSYSTSAFYAADAGIEKVLYRWNSVEENDSVFDWDSNPEFDNLMDGKQSYFLRKDVRDDNGEDILVIVSVGSFSQSEGGVEIRRGIQVSRPID